MKIELFVNKDWKTSEKKFTHYWYNEGQNFFDSVEQNFDGLHTYEKENIDFVSKYDGYTGPTEAYLEQFKEAGYSWQEINPIKFQRNNMFSGSIQIDRTDFDLYPVLFLRVTEDDDTFPKYYYSETIADISDQNFPNSYVIPLQMDMWATYWVYMHHFMKSSTEDVDFIQKMCNRFLFNTQYDEETGKRIDSQGFIIDYLQQPYLMRTNKYDTNLVVNDNRANFLTLEQWLFINSGKKDTLKFEEWLQDTWLNWSEKPYVGVFSPDTAISSGTPTEFTTDGIGKLQNKYATQLEGFYDTDYNSNTKYRYLVCKVGNNTSKSKADDEKMVEAKKGMFKNFNYDAVQMIGDTTVTCATLDTENWTEDYPQSYSWHKDLTLTGVSLGTGAVCISWDNWLVSDKFLTLHFTSSVLGDYYVTWADDLSLKSHRKVLNSISLNKEYSIIDLPTKSYAFDIYGDFVNVTLSINIKFTSETNAVLVFRVKFDKNYEKIVWPEITVKVDDVVTINDFNVSQTGTLVDKLSQTINGETLMIIPFKKGADEREYIRLLNDTNNGICLGDGSVIGMPINDIPPSVLALAIRRQNDNSDWQSIGDTLSVRSAGNVKCPIDLVDFKLGNYDIPVMFTSFDNIPITVASAPLLKDIYQCVGGNNFFNYFYDILTNTYLTGNTSYYDLIEKRWRIHGGNVIDCEPFLYSPQFWKWSYFIDGSHYIELTGEKIDFEKLLTNQDWEVKLNVNFNSITSYFLDISDIKNNKYPMTKLGMELINGDPSSFPFTTEAYNNWLQGNQLTQETAKNAKDITNEYVRKRGILDATVGSIEAGTAAAASAKGGLLGIGATASKALVFAGVAAAHATGAITDMKYTIAENNKQFENKWRGELSNYYNSPSQLNPSGFSSGSLVYSPISAANSNSYELFRTFSAPTYIKERVWHDISINGYPFVSQCAYADYNNRIRFNVVNCNLNDKQYIFFNYLREKMFDISPMFANDDAILTFIKKCQDLFRVFKCEYNADKMEQIISENIELDREWCEPYFAPKRTLIFENIHNVMDYQDTSWIWNNQYSWSVSGLNYYLTKNTTNEDYDVDIDYDELYVDDWEGFLKTYETLSLGNKNSTALLYHDEEIIKETVASNDADYGPGGIKLSEEITKFIESIETNDYLDKAIYVEKDSTKVLPTNYTLGWNVTISDNDGEGIHIHLEPVSRWTFFSSSDLTTGTIKNNETVVPIGEIQRGIGLNDSMNFPIEETEFRRIGKASMIYKGNPSASEQWQNGWTDYTVYNIGIPKESGAIFHRDPKWTTIEINYSDLGLGISTKEEFLKCFSGYRIEGNSSINCKINYPLSKSWNEFGEASYTGTFDGLLHTIGFVSIGDPRITKSEEQGYWTPCAKENKDIRLAEGIAGTADINPNSSAAWCSAKYGAFQTSASFIIQTYNSFLEIKISNQTRYATSGLAQGGFPLIPAFAFGDIVKSLITGEEGRKNGIIGLGQYGHLEELSYSMNIPRIVLIGTEAKYTTTWYMNNQINSVVLSKKDSRKLDDSIILKNKKEVI